MGHMYGFENSPEDMLWDQLVCGVNDDEIRQLLGVTDTKLDFKKALELVMSKKSHELQKCAGAGARRSPP